MKIEEAIVYVLTKRNGSGLHIRKDNQPVTSKQVYAVICRFPEIFTKEGGRIMLIM